MQNACEEGDPEGQYSPWMVVRRKRNGYKGDTPGKNLEGTSVHTQNSPPLPNPKITDRTNTFSYGPTHKLSTPRGDIQQRAASQFKYVRADRGLKFGGLFVASTSSRSECHIDGPLKFAARRIILKSEVSSKPGPECGASAQPHNTYPNLVKSKKAFARSFSSISNSSAAVIAQTNTNLLARLRPTPLSQSLSHEPVQPSNASFEILATTIKKGDPCRTSDGLGRGKSETHSRSSKNFGYLT